MAGAAYLRYLRSASSRWFERMICRLFSVSSRNSQRSRCFAFRSYVSMTLLTCLISLSTSKIAGCDSREMRTTNRSPFTSRALSLSATATEMGLAPRTVAVIRLRLAAVRFRVAFLFVPKRGREAIGEQSASDGEAE